MPKAAFKKANKPPPKSKAAKPKKKAKAKPTKKGRSLPEFPGFPAYYPPAGHLIDYNWDGGWYEGKFLRMEVDAEGRGVSCATLKIPPATTFIRFFCVRGKMTRTNGPSPSNGCLYSIATTVKRPRPATSFVLNAACQTTATKIGTAANPIPIDPLAIFTAP